MFPLFVQVSSNLGKGLGSPMEPLYRKLLYGVLQSPGEPFEGSPPSTTMTDTWVGGTTP
jgi:hypothetical protein